MPSPSPKRLLVLVAAIIAVAVGVAGMLIAPPAPDTQSAAPATGPEAAVPAGSNGADSGTGPAALVSCEQAGSFDQACLLEILETQVRTDGSDVALATLRAAGEVDEQAAMACHFYMHAIGEAASVVYDTLDAAYEVGTVDCQFGYHHGLLVGRAQAGSNEQFRSEVPGMCTFFEGQSFSKASCVHGIGHAAVALAGTDLALATSFCDELGDGESHNCVTGAVMEFAETTMTSVAADEPARRDEMISICDEIPDHLAACVREVSVGWLALNGNDFDATHDLCVAQTEGRDALAAQQCFLGIGFRAAAHAGFDATALGELCQSAPEEWEGWCWGGAATVTFEQFHARDPGKAESMCPAAPEPHQAVCEQVLDETRVGYAELDVEQASGAPAP